MSSFSNALDNWKAAGFRKTQVVLGVPFYGKTLSGVHSGKNGGVGQRYSGKAVVGLPYKDQIRVVDSWDCQWDDGEQAVTWFNKNKQVFCTLPDPQFMRSRTDWAMKHAGGVMIWALEHDNGDLIKAIGDTVRSGPAKPPSPSKTTTARPPVFTTRSCETIDCHYIPRNFDSVQHNVGYFHLIIARCAAQARAHEPSSPAQAKPSLRPR